MCPFGLGSYRGKKTNVVSRLHTLKRHRTAASPRVDATTEFWVFWCCCPLSGCGPCVLGKKEDGVVLGVEKGRSMAQDRATAKGPSPKKRRDVEARPNSFACLVCVCGCKTHRPCKEACETCRLLASSAWMREEEGAKPRPASLFPLFSPHAGDAAFFTPCLAWAAPLPASSLLVPCGNTCRPLAFKRCASHEDRQGVHGRMRGDQAGLVKKGEGT